MNRHGTGRGMATGSLRLGLAAAALMLAGTGCRVFPTAPPQTARNRSRAAAALPRTPVPWLVADSADPRLGPARLRAAAERLAAALPALLGPLPARVSPPWTVHLVPPGAEISAPSGRPSSGRRDWTGYTRWDRHEAWVRSAGSDPRETLRRLRHELTHVFLDAAAGAGPAFPLWLQEGIPCCFEAGILPGGLPAENSRRRRQLQYLLRARRGRIDLDQFLNRRADQPCSSNDYALAWGLVYFLATNRIDPRGREWLKACIDAAARANRRPGADVAAAVRRAFDGELRKRNMPLDEWARRWRKQVMHFHGRWPFGRS